MKAIETLLIHAGEVRPRIAGAVVMPIFQSSTYEFGGEEGYHNIRYHRLNNSPNHLVLHAKLAAIEEAESALVTASGMAAISTALLTVLSAGDHLLVQSHLYGGTYSLVTEHLPLYGITYDFIEGHNPATWESKLRPETRAIYVETIDNPLLAVPDLQAVVQFARRHRLISLVDNTFASPVNFRPVALGFDLSLHSGTKYLNGHNDLIAGAVIGGAELVERIRHKLNELGGCLDAHAAFLLHRGLKTLAVRVRRQNESARILAEALAAHGAVGRVYYPGLQDHPTHAYAARFLDGYGGMVSFDVVGGREAAARMVSRLELACDAPSLGGVDTLVSRPALLSHAGLDPVERDRLGIQEGLIRVSVGLEAADDLVTDFCQALEA
jgi:cystathionine beta-lyase/cystathionine gamma-synthase